MGRKRRTEKEDRQKPSVAIITFGLSRIARASVERPINRIPGVTWLFWHYEGLRNNLKFPEVDVLFIIAFKCVETDQQVELLRQVIQRENILKVMFIDLGASPPGVEKLQKTLQEAGFQGLNLNKEDLIRAVREAIGLDV
jgi:hypothetical protein